MNPSISTRDDLQSLVGQSIPSVRFGAWIVDTVRGNIDGRSRLVSGNLMFEQWVWTRDLVRMLQKVKVSK